MKSELFKLEINDKKTLEVEINDLAERANGSVLAKMGNTIIMATAVMAKREIEGTDFSL